MEIFCAERGNSVLLFYTELVEKAIHSLHSTLEELQEKCY